MADQVATDTDTDSEDAHDDGSPSTATRKIHASGNPHHTALMQKLHTYSAEIRTFAQQRLASKDRGDITKILEDRPAYVPTLAKNYGVTEQKINMALDVLALIRKV